MTKKTRRQKIVAELRRKTHPGIEDALFVKSQISRFEAKSEENTYHTVLEKTNIDTKPRMYNSEAEHSHVRKDLIKITIFSLTSLFLQGVIYFLLNRHLV